MAKKTELFLPKDTSAEVRRAFIALIDHAKDSVTKEDLKNPDFILNQTIIINNGVNSGDTQPPIAPSNLVATKYENKNRLTWVNSPSTDASGVYVYRSLTPGGALSFAGVVTAPSSSWNDLDVNPFQSYYYYIVAVDDSGNVSDQIPSVDGTNVVLATTLPAPDAILSATWDQEDLNLSWDPVDGFGVMGYRVLVVGRRTIDTVSPNYSYTFAINSEDGAGTPGTSLTIRIWTIGSDGALSAAYVENTFIHALPPTVRNAVAGMDSLGFKLSWDKSTSPIVTGYDIALGDVLLETNYATESYLYKTLLTAGVYALRVRSRNKFGQVSGWNTQSLHVAGPGVPQNLTTRVIDNWVMLYWEAPVRVELPIVEYEIRQGATWATGTIVGRKQGTFTTDQQFVAGNYRYMVAAVDSAGNIGPCVSITVYIYGPPDYSLNVEWIDDFLNGIPTNVLVLADGSAIAPCHNQTWAAKFIGTGTELDPQFTCFQDMIDAGNTYFVEPVPLTAEFSEEHDYGAVLRTSSVASSLNRDVYNGGPSITTFIARKELIGGAYIETEGESLFATDFRYVRDRFTFESDGHQFTVMDNHTLRLDSQLKNDTGKSEVVVAVDGLIVYFNRPFVDVQSISITPMGTIPLIAVVDFEDRPNPKYFTVYLFNLSGVAQAAPFTWQAKGY